MEVEVVNPLSGYPVSTILWFEYLLDSSLLEKQLKRENSGKSQQETKTNTCNTFCYPFFRCFSNRFDY